MKRIICILLMVFCIIGNGFTVYANQNINIIDKFINDVNKFKIEHDNLLNKNLISDIKSDKELNSDETVKIIVELESDSTVKLDNGDYTNNTKKIEKNIMNNQENIISKVESLTGNKVIRQFGYLINCFSIYAKRSDFDEIMKIKGIKNISESKVFSSTINSTDKLKKAINSYNNYAYNGEGIVVSIIDTGIDVTHKDFLNIDDNKIKLDKNNVEKKINEFGYGKYYTDKIPYGYNYADRNDDIVEHNSWFEHGMHVAGIVAANGNEDEIENFEAIKGIAPEAQILAMKVFSNNSLSASSDDIIAAIEDSVKLGADIINISIGNDCGFMSEKDPEQEAINRATDLGVICIAAAGNAQVSSSTSSFDEPNNIVNIIDNSTINAPSIAQNCISVAAMNNSIDSEYKMSSFSSWGPSNTLDLKPDITAPGENIYSTQNDNEYDTLSGTSMATPYVAGVEALIIQRIKAENLNIANNEIVNFCKSSIMNTAEPLTKNNIPYSPRRQGAGSIQIENALYNNVLVTSQNNIASVSLKEIDTNTTFTLKVTNYGKEEASYTIQNCNVYTEEIDELGYIEETLLDGAQVYFDKTNITVPSKSSEIINVTLKLPEMEKQKFIEGFITFTSDKNPNLSIPFMGFYGDWGTENTIDPIKSDINTNNKVITGLTGLMYDSEMGSIYSGVVTNDDGSYIDTEKISFSPNKDGFQDSIYPCLYMLRNTETIEVEILSEDGKLLRKLDKEFNIPKNTIENLPLCTNLKSASWDGYLYDQKSGEYVIANDGNYAMRIITSSNSIKNSIQTLEIPIKVDTIPPEIEIENINNYYDEKNKQHLVITWTALDDNVGVYPYFEILINNNYYSFTNSNLSIEDNKYTADIIFNDEVTSLSLIGQDYAGNIEYVNDELNLSTSEYIFFNNLYDNLQLNKTNLSESNLYEIFGYKGKNISKLYINNIEINCIGNVIDYNLPVAEGKNSINILGYNSSGDSVVDITYNVYVDTIPPTINVMQDKIFDESYYHTYNDTIELDINIVDTNEVSEGYISIRNNYTYEEIMIDLDKDNNSKEILALAEGTNYISINAYDNFGNTNCYNIMVIKGDMQNFDCDTYVTINSNIDDNSFISIVPNDIFTIKGLVSSSIKELRINNDIVKLNKDNTFTYNLSLKEGINLVKWYGVNFDDSVCINYSSKLLYDTKAPVVEINKNNLLTNVPQYNISGYICDDISDYTLYINGDIIDIDSIHTANNLKNEFLKTINLVEGENIILIEAIDSSANKFVQKLTVVLDTITPKPPKINMNISDDKQIVNLLITTDESDIDKIEYSFDNYNYYTYEDYIKLNKNCTIFARVIDKAGNISDIAQYKINSISSYENINNTLKNNKFDETNSSLILSNNKNSIYIVSNCKTVLPTTGVIFSKYILIYISIISIILGSFMYYKNSKR